MMVRLLLYVLLISNWLGVFNLSMCCGDRCSGMFVIGV